MSRVVKREQGTDRGNRAEAGETSDSNRQGVTERRVLRSRYLAVKHLINEDKEDISKTDSEKFTSFITQIESLHQLVQKPREQVADAEVLLDIANSLVTSVKSHSNEGVTPSDFITSLLKNFDLQNGVLAGDTTSNSLSWKDVGVAVSHVFKTAPGCFTMLGPMNTELKQRKAVVRKKRVGPTQSTHPEEVRDAGEEKTDTDKNMGTMFEILRKKRSVRLEHLVLNRISFAQTVENIFSLSFLVKDGRAEITVNKEGRHFVSPRNAPSANAIASGDVTYSHFVFRFDFSDWRLMVHSVGASEELMPHRSYIEVQDSSQVGPSSTNSQAAEAVDNSQGGGPSTPIRKLTRNRGLVIQEESVVEDTHEKSDSPRQKRKRLFAEFGKM